MSTQAVIDSLDAEPGLSDGSPERPHELDLLPEKPPWLEHRQPWVMTAYSLLLFALVAGLSWRAPAQIQDQGLGGWRILISVVMFATFGVGIWMTLFEAARTRLGFCVFLVLYPGALAYTILQIPVGVFEWHVWCAGSIGIVALSYLRWWRPLRRIRKELSIAEAGGPSVEVANRIRKYMARTRSFTLFSAKGDGSMFEHFVRDYLRPVLQESKDEICDMGSKAVWDELAERMSQEDRRHHASRWIWELPCRQIAAAEEPGEDREDPENAAWAVALAAHCPEEIGKTLETIREESLWLSAVQQAGAVCYVNEHREVLGSLLPQLLGHSTRVDALAEVVESKRSKLLTA